MFVRIGIFLAKSPAPWILRGPLGVHLKGDTTAVASLRSKAAKEDILALLGQMLF